MCKHSVLCAKHRVVCGVKTQGSVLCAKHRIVCGVHLCDQDMRQLPMEHFGNGSETDSLRFKISSAKKCQLNLLVPHKKLTIQISELLPAMKQLFSAH